MDPYKEDTINNMWERVIIKLKIAGVPVGVQGVMKMCFYLGAAAMGKITSKAMGEPDDEETRRQLNRVKADLDAYLSELKKKHGVDPNA